MREANDEEFLKVVESVIGNLTGETVDTANLIGLLKERSDSREIAYNWYTEVILSSVYIFIAILGIIFNIFISCIILCSKKLLQNPSNILVINLMASDLLMAIFCIPFTLISTIRRSYMFGSLMCKLIPFLQSTSILVCSFTITTIAIDRLIRITRNYQRSTYQVLFAKTHWWLITIETGAIWLMSLSISLPVAFYQKLIQVGDYNSLAFKKCIEHWPSETMKGYYTVLVMVTQFVITTTVLIISHMVIGNKLNRNLSGLTDVSSTINANNNATYEPNEHESPTTGSNEGSTLNGASCILRPKSSTGSVNSAISCLSLFTATTNNNNNLHNNNNNNNNNSSHHHLHQHHHSHHHNINNINNGKSIRKSSLSLRHHVQYSTVTCGKNGQGHIESIKNNDSHIIYLSNGVNVASRNESSLKKVTSVTRGDNIDSPIVVNGNNTTSTSPFTSCAMDTLVTTILPPPLPVISSKIRHHHVPSECVVEMKSETNDDDADEDVDDNSSSIDTMVCSSLQLKSYPCNVETIKSLSNSNSLNGHFISKSIRASRNSTSSSSDVTHPNSPCNSIELSVTHGESFDEKEEEKEQIREEDEEEEMSSILRQNTLDTILAGRGHKEQNVQSAQQQQQHPQQLVSVEESIFDIKILLTNNDLPSPTTTPTTTCTSSSTSTSNTTTVSKCHPLAKSAPRGKELNFNSPQLLPTVAGDCITTCNAINVTTNEHEQSHTSHASECRSHFAMEIDQITISNRLPYVKRKAIKCHPDSLTPSPIVRSVSASNANRMIDESFNCDCNSSSSNSNNKRSNKSNNNNNNIPITTSAVSPSMVHSPSLATSCMLSPSSVSRRFTADQRDILMRELRRNRQVTRVLLSITACFTLNWLPWNVFNVYLDFNENTTLSIGSIYLIQAICHLIAMITIPLNAFWYGWSNPLIRSEGIRRLTSLYHMIQIKLRPIMTLGSTSPAVN